MITKTYNPDKDTYTVVFGLPADTVPHALEVKVLGDFNNWDWNQGTLLTKTAFFEKPISVVLSESLRGISY